MTARTRTRDPQAFAVGEKIIAEMDVSADQVVVTKLAAMRGFSAGKQAREPEVVSLQRQLAERAEALSKAERRAGGFPFGLAEMRYIETVHTYGMSIAEIAKVFDVDAVVIKDVIASGKAKVDFGKARRGKKGVRAIQV